PATVQPTSPQPYCFSVEDYQRLGETGIFGQGDRVELIAGEIIKMSPIGTKHQACVARINQILGQELGDRAIVWPQNAIQLSENSQPQPDIALLTPRDDFYRDRYPQPSDILLIIEVADSTIRYDRDVKIPLYGSAGIPEAWIVDLNRNCIEVYQSPDSDGYRSKQTYDFGQTLTPIRFPQRHLAIASLLGI
ncbi:MAG: Uma2 family endonuclease, partial [Jaaginema sp. PMC 1079.18]|nr:Uma2 family endonuclease [Jaaginema sp. PMC 1079.18]